MVTGTRSTQWRGRQTLLLLAVPTLFLVSCSRDLSLQPDSVGPRFEIQDAAHSSGDPHFFFLPPLVPQPNYSGVFEARFSPIVQICEWIDSRCATPPVAEFSMSSGPGSKTVRVDLEDQLYVVNWHTDKFSLDPAKIVIAGSIFERLRHRTLS